MTWQRNLAVVWFSQFLSIAGFAFAIPFLPFYMQQDLGVTDPRVLKLCIMLSSIAAPLSLAIFSPIWGSIGDRYGRRLMLLRANFGAAIVLCLMGTVTSVWQLVTLRVMQGVFTGTMVAAQTMVAVRTPKCKTGFALGTLATAVSMGAVAGNFFGGLLAEQYGHRKIFFLAATLLLSAGTLVVFGTVENTIKEKREKNPPTRRRAVLPHAMLVTPFLIVLGMTALARRFDAPMLPLLVQEIHGTVKGSSFWTGSLLATSGIAMALSAFAMGWLVDRAPPDRIAGTAAVIAGILLIPQSVATSLAVLFPARFLMLCCVGGIETVFMAWISKTTPEESRGAIFGWANSARSVGWLCSAILSCGIALVADVRAAFLGGAICFLTLAIAVPRISKMARKTTGGAQ